jgi:hypothetical protein
MPEIPQRNFTGGELDPALHARSDLTKYRNGLATLRNFKIHAQGGVSNREGTEFIAEVKGSAPGRLIPFEFNKDQAYILEFTDLLMRVYIYNVLTGSSGLVLYDPGGGIFEMVTPYLEADLPLLKYVQSADTMTICHPDYSEKDLTRTDHDAWTLSEISYAPTISTVGALSAVEGGDGGGDHDKTYAYVVTGVNPDGEESLRSNVVTETTKSLDGTHYIDITWAALFETPEYYNVYKAESETSDIFGWIGESNTLTFRDYNLLPDISDTADAEARDPFPSLTGDDFPAVVTYYQQRQIFGRTNNNRQTIFATQSGNYKSMRRSRPTKADDSIERTIAAQTVNEIRHFVELDSLLILTSGGEWRVTEGQDGVMTPASIGFRQQTDYGSSDVPPVKIGNSALFVQTGGKTVRDLAYTFQSDAYAGNDLSLLAKHLFKNRTVKEWAYAQEPDGIVWTVMDDGTMLGLTYQKEHQVFGWHHHDTQGTFESVAVIPENDLDAVYVIVKRTIDGTTKRYVERMKPRDWLVAEDAFIVDCGLTYDSTPATTISGLDHLEAMEVVALADGNVVRVDDLGAPLTVSSGAITLPTAASKVHIGLAYISDFETLDIDPVQSIIQRDAFRGKPMNVGEVIVKVKDSRGGYIGPDETKLNELPSRSVLDSYDPLALQKTEYRISLEEDWTSNGKVFIRQTDPLPMTILAVIPDVDVG